VIVIFCSDGAGPGWYNGGPATVECRCAARECLGVSNKHIAIHVAKLDS